MLYRFECKKCENWVELPPRKGGVMPWTPTCNNAVAHHHPRGELMTFVKEVKSRRRRVQEA